VAPLSDIKVLDLSRVLAGPWATQCLADFGATVWKIERPGSGDDTRQWGPPWLKDADGRETELIPQIADLLRLKGTQQWLDALAAVDVPGGPINDLAQVFAEPQVQHRSMQTTVTHPLAGALPLVRNPVLFSRDPSE
jgi:crotonobetainyl-CoA:carnitine CoA-transferase CaiB-like acyl-CoA transferase